MSAGLAQAAAVSLQMATVASRRKEEERASWSASVRDRLEGHLRLNGLDPERIDLSVGPWLGLDPSTGRFVEERARQFETRSYREPFVLPDSF